MLSPQEEQDHDFQPDSSPSLQQADQADDNDVDPYAEAEAELEHKNQNNHASPSTRLFQPYRVVGHVCDEVKLHLKKLGQEHFVTLSIGKSWQVYNVISLTALSPISRKLISLKIFTVIFELYCCRWVIL